MKETWKPIPSLENRYIICLETCEVRSIRTGKTLKPNPSGVINSSWGLGYSGGKHRWGRSVSSLMEEVFPYWWIRTLEEGEEVKPVKGFKGYFITNKSRLYSTHTHQWMKPKHKPPYYYQVYLFDTSYTKIHTYIHTLVGRHFLPEWEEGLFVLHREETLPYPEINFPDNLWIGDSGDNNRDRCLKGRSGGFMKGRTYNGVLQIK